MATDYSGLRRLLAAHDDQCETTHEALADASIIALPELLDEIETLRKGIDPWRRLRMRDKDRIAQLEAEIPRLVALITCDMGPDCPRPEHWPDCAINVAKDIARAALVEGKEPA